MRRLAPALLALTVTLAGCTSGEEPDDLPTATAPDGDTPTRDAGTSSPTASPTASQTAAPGPSWLDVGLPAIELTTPHEGGGDRPVLSWQPVDGAASYTLVLRDGNGRTYWSWIGTATEVPVGGVDLPDTVSGPRVSDDTTWAVMALDDALLPVAVSEVRPIRP